ncbi:MAG: peptidylprolyl isomerase, partial [Planctomycetes bacterium]|nr:peptidylprolyl isomerase [Planctomycetota bacterium]
MHTPIRTFSIAAIALTAALSAPAQDKKPNPLVGDSGPQFVTVRYPQDKDKAIAVVGGKTLTLGELIRHLDTRHYPGFERLVRELPTFQGYLQSDLMPAWVRQFADLEALRQHLGDRYVDPVELEKAQSASLKKSFEDYLAKVVEDRRQTGRTTELSQRHVNRLLSDFQLKRGLSAELQGMLDLLEPDDYTRKELRDFFNDNARYFGGQVTIQHILIQHRDGGTGLLLKDDGLARANARVAEVKARLRADGSNFNELVRLFSDDNKTRHNDGRLPGVHRFDDRLPAALCRAAWSLRDGEVTPDVVE